MSRVYYRYEEGDDYDEIFGDREVEGEVLVRRNLSITAGKLRRIGTPQGTFRRSRSDDWSRGWPTSRRSSRAGRAPRCVPESYHRPGELGIGDDDLREDKHLSEITALIDPRQFELISKPTSGLVVIQGGAGSGKTTIGLHRLAYLAFQDSRSASAPTRCWSSSSTTHSFATSRACFPALGVEDVPVQTFQSWAEQQRRCTIPKLTDTLRGGHPDPRRSDEEAPRDAQGDRRSTSPSSPSESRRRFSSEAKSGLEGGSARASRVWRRQRERATRRAARAARFSWLTRPGRGCERGRAWRPPRVERICQRWLGAHSRRGDGVGGPRHRQGSASFDAFANGGARARSATRSSSGRTPGVAGTRRASCSPMKRHSKTTGERISNIGVDGADEDEPPALDREDDALLLRVYQALRGPLTGRRRRCWSTSTSSSTRRRT